MQVGDLLFAIFAFLNLMPIVRVISSTVKQSVFDFTFALRDL
jgi:hypothetical protein